ncbi:phosphate:sodium symporter [Alkalispirochaeta odontotermitis]|nr:phosphate:sodium symporter [Alkalispirochaeta odontotermitis]CAB1076930.1 Probable low-affinity inorganic phosphate transporter [Olavius algarvensis Delta 1 endosymbiont]
MGIEVFFIAVIILLLFAVFDLSVGVANDAVNFLNSSIGSRVAPYVVIMIVASLGILAGVTFSGGMMEVARKGIFHPQFFTMPELIMIFMAVMLTDILLLDLLNAHGLPTSTTVSIVFELLGAAVAVSLIKIMSAADGSMTLGEYINTGKAMMIVFGILLSIAVAFFCGAAVQFVSRLIFTFDYQKRLKRYGAIWGGVAMATITFFIMVKGAKGASFMTPEAAKWILSHTMFMLASIFVVSAIIFQILISFFNVNILKPVVLVGTFALAMAFAANDLVNFIGVPLAGLNAYQTAVASSDPLNITMVALSKKVQSHTLLLLIAGGVMVLTLWLSKKARTVTETEISLGQQEEGTERFESIWLSRSIVSMVHSVVESIKSLTPRALREHIGRRIDPNIHRPAPVAGQQPSFDLVRASVNLMVASAVVSFATSLKLPLSTTYVTFMVAMGTSFSDQAWGMESAVYRVTGVLTVIGGWFMTALIAFVTSFVFAAIVYYLKVPGVLLLMILAAVIIRKNHKKHAGRVREKEEQKIFNLRKVKDAHAAVSNTFDHVAYFLKEIRLSLDISFDALFAQNVDTLNRQRKKVKQIQVWSNIIMANIFKVLRLLQKEEPHVSFKYAQTIRRLQKLSDGHRDIVLRSYVHTSNKHKGLLDVQIRELQKAKACILEILAKVEDCFNNKEIVDYRNIIDLYQHIRELADEFNQVQIERIRNDTSKTRLSILYYGIMGNCLMLTKQNIKLLEIFNESFQFDKRLSESYFKFEK